MSIYTHKALDLLEKHSLDIAVAEKFLGWKLEEDHEKSGCMRWFNDKGEPTKFGTGCGMRLFHPSEDLNIAFPEIIERLKESNLTITCTITGDLYTCGIYNDMQREMAHWYDASLGVAICKAALKLLIRKVNKENKEKAVKS